MSVRTKRLKLLLPDTGFAPGELMVQAWHMVHPKATPETIGGHSSRKFPDTELHTTINFTQLIPSVYYVDITHGLKLFVDCLGFVIGHDEIKSEQPFCVLNKDGLSIYLFEHAKLAREHNPEFRLVTKNIEQVYEKVSQSHPEFLHPNLSEVTLRPWGAKEFAIRDEQVCIIIQQW